MDHVFIAPLIGKVIKKAAELKPGMVITLQNNNKYCKAITNTCGATDTESYRVVDGGNGFVALHSGEAHYQGSTYSCLYTTCHV